MSRRCTFGTIDYDISLIECFKNAKKTLAENIKCKRLEAGLSQEALALAAEVDRTYVSQIERGVGNPSLLILCRIAGVLETEPASLLLTAQAVN